jgi:hypothetical protein
MVGTLLSSPNPHNETVRVWMETITSDGGVERYDDLHIDRIDAAWKPREVWISAGLESFGLAVSIRNSHGLDLVVVLAFSLESGEAPRGFNLTMQKDLEQDLHATPPSLYLLRPGTEFWTQPAEHMTVADVDWRSLFGTGYPIAKCVFMEFKRQNSDDYTRSLFVVG